MARKPIERNRLKALETQSTLGQASTAIIVKEPPQKVALLWELRQIFP
jgi:hypothetical protein